MAHCQRPMRTTNLPYFYNILNIFQLPNQTKNFNLKETLINHVDIKSFFGFLVINTNFSSQNEIKIHNNQQLFFRNNLQNLMKRACSFKTLTKRSNHMQTPFSPNKQLYFE